MGRYRNNLFAFLAAWMVAFGLLMGLAFPFFTLALGIPPEFVLTPAFWTATVGAGLIVGGLNFMLARRVVRPRLQQLAEHMRRVETNLMEATYTGDWRRCSPDACHIEFPTEDELGTSAEAFNDLVAALFHAHEVEGAVNDFANQLSEQLELAPMCRRALELMSHHLNTPAGMLIKYEEGQLSPVYSHGIRDPERVVASDELRRALEVEHISFIHQPRAVEGRAALVDFTPLEVAVVPLHSQERLLGAALLANDKAFTGTDRRLLSLLRNPLILTFNNALIHENAQRLAVVDSLTGAYNRRFADIRLREEFQRALRGGHPLALLMLDVDGFKAVNDQYGHLQADQILRRTTQLIQADLREGDVVARYGGDEFLLILPGATLATAASVAERIREATAAAELAGRNTAGAVTVSVGVAGTAEPTTHSAQELLARADTALYRAKNQGRDQVVVVETGEPEEEPLHE